MEPLPHLTLRQLEYLVALAETLNFRRAAERCHVSQPALSTQVQRLEEALGVALFERSRRRVALTAAGAAAVAKAREVLARTRELAAEARGRARPLTGTLRLGVIPTVAPFVLPRVLPPLRRRHPELRLLLREDQTARLVEGLASSELDLLLLALEAPLGDVVKLPLYRDPFVVAMHREHPLAGRRLVREKDLEQTAVLLLEDGHCLRDQALAVCQQPGPPEVGDFRASSLNTLIRMVAGGIGVTLLPAMAVPSEVRREEGLVARPLPQRVFGRTIGLCWRPTSPRGDEFRLLAETFVEHAPAGTEPLARISRSPGGSAPSRRGSPARSRRD